VWWWLLDRPVKPGDDNGNGRGIMHRVFAVLLSVLLGALSTGPSHAQTGAQPGSQAPLAYVSVAGAPGDGEQTLAEALGRQLAARGIAPATAFQANIYEVQGTVRVAAGSRNKESVTIIWVVLAPDGTQLGVTRQMKEVRKGSLDKKWGTAAEAAAAAAAADIAKLIPR
jgi:hypothetical protein